MADCFGLFLQMIGFVGDCPNLSLYSHLRHLLPRGSRLFFWRYHCCTSDRLTPQPKQGRTPLAMPKSFREKKLAGFRTLACKHRIEQFTSRGDTDQRNNKLACLLERPIQYNALLSILVENLEAAVRSLVISAAPIGILPRRIGVYAENIFDKKLYNNPFLNHF